MALFALLATLLIVAAAANAATLTVATTGDPATPNGQCSLREAIVAVNTPGSPSDCGAADALSNTIVLGPHTYTLSIKPTGGDDQTTGDLDVDPTAGPLTVIGAGVGTTTISGAGLGDRVMNVLPGARVTLRDLTVTGGQAPNGGPGTNASGATAATTGSPGSFGGGIRNGGTLVLDDVSVTDNTAGSGGIGGDGGFEPVAAGAAGGAGGAGGGIHNDAGAMLTLSDVTVSGNTAGAGGAGGIGLGNGSGAAPGGNGGCCGDGGGLANAGGTVMITDSTFADNHAGAGGAGGDGGDAGFGLGSVGGTGAGGSSGGAIASAGGSISISNTTIANNTSGVGGTGGFGGLAAETGSTSGNGGGAGNGSAGGGVFISGGATATLLNVTVDGNLVGAPGTPGSAGVAASGATKGSEGAPGQPAFGGGIYDNTTPAMMVSNTLLGTNQLGNCAGQINDGGHNLTFGQTGCPAGFLVGDPKLGPLQDNGGSTETMALGAGSAAIDQVPVTGAGCPSTDQRGAARPSGSACDIGAYELALPAVSVATTTAVTSTGATVHASVTPNQSSASVGFEYGTTISYGSSTPAQNLVGGFAAQPTAATLTDLKPGTTYHFRVVATSADGTTTGADATFRTAQSAPVPTRPRVTKLRVKLLKGGRAGARVSYSDSEAATTTIVLRRCVKRAKHGRGCKRFRLVGTLKHVDVAGANAVTVHHELGHHTLVPGSYQLELIPSLGHLAGRELSIGFAI